MFEVGRLCMKTVGRDAGKKCLIIDVIDEHFVLIDGQTRRRKCNIKHLEPLNQTVQLTKNAPAPEVVRVLKEIGILVEEKKPKAKATKAKAGRPTKARKKKEKPVKDAKEIKPSKPAKGVKKQPEMPVEKKSVEAEKNE